MLTRKTILLQFLIDCDMKASPSKVKILTWLFSLSLALSYTITKIIVIHFISCFILKPKSLSFTCHHLLSFVFIRCITLCSSLLFVITHCITLCHSLSFVVTSSHSLSLVVIFCHSLSLVIICCHLLSLVVSLVFTRCTTRCHSLSFVVTCCHSLWLVVPLFVTCCHSIYHSSVFLWTILCIFHFCKNINPRLYILFLVDKSMT